MSGSELVESLEYEDEILSFALTVDRLTTNSIDAASLFESHSDLEYNGRWGSQDLQMPDERVEQQFGKLINDLEDGATAYRFLRQDLGGEDLPDQYEVSSFRPGYVPGGEPQDLVINTPDVDGSISAGFESSIGRETMDVVVEASHDATSEEDAREVTEYLADLERSLE